MTGISDRSGGRQVEARVYGFAVATDTSVVKPLIITHDVERVGEESSRHTRLIAAIQALGAWGGCDQVSGSR